jgi:hypothetical protein
VVKDQKKALAIENDKHKITIRTRDASTLDWR